MNRKDFLKRFGTGIGVSVIMPALLLSKNSDREYCWDDFKQDHPDYIGQLNEYSNVVTNRSKRKGLQTKFVDLEFTGQFHKPWGENIAKSTPVVINMSAWTEHSN